jgi:hypothetical protein
MAQNVKLEDLFQTLPQAVYFHHSGAPAKGGG